MNYIYLLEEYMVADADRSMCLNQEQQRMFSAQVIGM